MGSPQFFDSQKDAVGLIEPTIQALSGPAIIKSGTAVGYYVVPWAKNVQVVTKKDIELNKWSNAISKSYVNLYPIIEPKFKGDIVGTVTITLDNGQQDESEVVLAADVSPPSVKWRLKNPTK